MANRKRAAYSSEMDIASVTWEDVFSKTTGIPRNIRQRVIMSDNPPSVLHSFMQSGTHAAMIKSVMGDQYFPEVEAAVKEIIEGLGSKRIRIEGQFPSPSDYGKSGKCVEGICDHRSSSGLHVGIQVQAFGKFITSMESEKVVSSKYYRVASTLMQAMSNRLPAESFRVLDFIEIVRPLGEMFNLSSASGDNYRSDCTLNVGGKNIANWEFKNEFGSTGACPVSQNIAYFVHLQKGRPGRCPMLLVSVIGCHYLQVFGAVWNGHKCVCVDPLCSPISLLFVPRDPINGVSKLARLLSVMDETMVELTSASHDVNIDRGPYWTDDGYLEYREALKKPINWLFKAATLEGEEVVVKFVRGHYGEAVHNFLAANDFAPKLIKCQLLPGGWYAVVMEKLEGKSLVSCVQISDEVKVSLKKAVDLMHKLNYVHGDLRPQNILIVNETVRVLDFDWADVEHTATYPPELSMNPECNWHRDVQPGGKILKDHDLHQINSLDY